MAEIHGLGVNNSAFMNGLSSSCENIGKGTLANFTITVDEDPLSKLANAAEEMTFAKDNSKQTKLANRKQKSLSDETSERVKKMQKLMQNSVQDKGKTQNLKANFQKFNDKKLLLDEASSSFQNYALAYAALLELYENSVDEKEKTFFKDCADLLLKENSSEIYASLNSLDEAIEAKIDEDVIDSCNTYCEVVSNFKGADDMLLFLEKKYGKDFEKGLDFLVKALGADLQAKTPSHDKVFLEFVASGLDYTRILYSGLSHVNNFLDRISSVHNLDCKNISNLNFLKNLISLGEVRFLTSIDVSSLVKEVKVKNPEDEVMVAQELLATVRNCSEQLFSGNENRNKVIDAIQHLVDEKVQKEDEWLEQL